MRLTVLRANRNKGNNEKAVIIADISIFYFITKS